MTPPQESRRHNPYLLAAASVAGVGLDDESRCALRAPQAAECPVAERSAREGTGATGQLSLSEARDLMRQMRAHDAAQDWGGIVQLGKRLLRTFRGACSPPQTCTVATVSTVSVSRRRLDVRVLPSISQDADTALHIACIHIH